MTEDQLWAMKTILELAKDYMRETRAVSKRKDKEHKAAVLVIELLIAENE
jgi:hypothetical protein